MKVDVTYIHGGRVSKRGLLFIWSWRALTPLHIRLMLFAGRSGK